MPITQFALSLHTSGSMFLDYNDSILCRNIPHPLLQYEGAEVCLIVKDIKGKLFLVSQHSSLSCTATHQTIESCKYFSRCALKTSEGTEFQ